MKVNWQLTSLEEASSLNKGFNQTSQQPKMEQNKVEPPEKRRVAKSAIFILFSVILERYSTAGISSILVLFINLKLGYDQDESTAIYHSFEFLVAIFVIVGAIIADSWLGIYKTIIWMSMIFAAGSILIAVSATDALYLPIRTLSIVGLVIIAFGIGCLKPLGGTYGAQQYKATEVKSIALFFAIYYFMYNTGSLITRFVNPILRQDVKCFGNDDCFGLVFGIPAIFMVLVALLVIVANRYSEAFQSNGTTFLNVFACIWHAIVIKTKSRKFIKLAKKYHWLDYSEEKYGKMLVLETRVILNVLVLYLPVPLFWALFYQQYSRWVFQAARMNGDLGFYTIIPDQINVINPLLVIIMIPIFEYVIYPLLSKVGIRTALQKVTVGGVLAGVAFLISAIIESQIDGKYLHMVWLIPQYLVMAMADIMIYVSLMNFSYSEAPKSMKSILQAFSLFCIGLGNLIVAIVAGSRLINSQFYEFILFAGLMFVDMVIFGFLAYRYKPLKLNEDEGIENGKG